MKSFTLFYFILILVSYSTIVDAQWYKQTNGLPEDWGVAWAIDASDSNNAFISTNAGLFRTTDGGDSWLGVELPDSINETLIDVSMSDPSHVWCASDFGKIIATTDAGQSWIVQFDDVSLTSFMNYIEMFNDSSGLAMGDNPSESGPALFLRTIDGGINWESVNDSAFGGYSGDSWRRVDFATPRHGYFYESGINPQKLFKTTDGCENWFETNYSGYAAVLKCFNRFIVLVSDENSKISRTTDGGDTWEESLLTGGWGNDLEYIPDIAAKVYFTDFDNLYFSSDTGKTWSVILSDTTELNGRDIVFTDENHGWILGDYGSLYKTNSGGQLTNLNDEGNTPIDFSLAQNYPNPFNPTTTIKYTIPNVTLSPDKNGINSVEGSRVQLKVYDILGNEIATLVNEEKPAGSYQVEFDGSNLSSGVYFYQLKAGNYFGTKKMTLIK